MNPKIIERAAMIIAGTSGDGNKTWDVWNAFEKLGMEKPITNKLSDNGYEIRLYDGEACAVYVGLAVSEAPDDAAYTSYSLPASEYAVFDVCVANGYDSENNAMNEWLDTNRQGYKERLSGGIRYSVLYYGDRFHGDEAGSIAEVWIPIEKI